MPIALVAAAVCLAAGLTLPIMHVRWLFMFDRPVSLLGGIAALARRGDLGTAAILFAFSALFPAAKIALLLGAWAALRRGRPVPRRLLAVLQLAGRWSMLDVMVVALVVFAIEARPLAEADIAGAAAAFVAAIALTAYGAAVLERANRAAEPGAGGQKR